ncbi:MAG: hypothetical protein SF028_06535 [Candidatus Sumerlaeia bacterium]|nr:hypothetical protein [Candidatus Sumerlaeia bacterium]
MIKVACRQSSCAYFNRLELAAEAQTHCNCSHPEKRHYLGATPCPLFRMNWEGVEIKGIDKAKELIRSKRRM